MTDMLYSKGKKAAIYRRNEECRACILSIRVCGHHEDRRTTSRLRRRTNRKACNLLLERDCWDSGATSPSHAHHASYLLESSHENVLSPPSFKHLFSLITHHIFDYFSRGIDGRERLWKREQRVQSTHLLRMDRPYLLLWSQTFQPLAALQKMNYVWHIEPWEEG